MPLVPWWALLSSSIAPVLLVSGWLTATALQPTTYDPVTQTISSLAALDATDRWLMTAVLALVGACLIVTAYGLGRVRAGGRVALLFGGVCAILVALSPEPGGGATSPQHLVAAALGFTTLAVWPCLALERGPSVPWPLRPAVSLAFTAVVVGSAVWFVLALHAHGEAGVAERVVTGLQALWPVVVTSGLRRASVPVVRVIKPGTEVRAAVDSPSTST
jgi:hypothetical membrane protein